MLLRAGLRIGELDGQGITGVGQPVGRGGGVGCGALNGRRGAPIDEA